jgi:membrane protein
MTDVEARGRDARHPQDLSRPGWRDVLLRTKDELSADHVSIVAAGVAFFALLAIFPAIAALISIAGLVMDPGAVQSQLEALAGVLPPNAAQILQGQARQVAQGAGAGLGLGVAAGIGLSLYSASRGIKVLIEGMNIAYDEDESSVCSSPSPASWWRPPCWGRSACRRTSRHCSPTVGGSF